jgi:hypothetical protein
VNEKYAPTPVTSTRSNHSSESAGSVWLGRKAKPVAPELALDPLNQGFAADGLVNCLMVTSGTIAATVIASDM